MYVSEKLNSLDSEFGDGFKAAEMSRLRVAVRSNVSMETIYLFYLGLDLLCHHFRKLLLCTFIKCLAFVILMAAI